MSEASEPFALDLLACNADALLMEGASRERLLAAEPQGEWIRLPDGDPAIRYRDTVLGAPADEASRSRTLQDISTNPHGVVVVFGFGAGHAVRQIRERGDLAVVVVEPSPGILRRVLTQGPTDLGGVPVVIDLQQLKTCWANLARGRSLATLVTTPGYDAAFPDEHAELAALVPDLVGKVQLNENTYRARSRAWLDHVLENVDQLAGAVPAMALADSFEGVPAFILGAGPSLNHNGALLREAARRGIVMAVDVAGKICAHHNAEPQVLVSIESIDLSAQFKDLPWIDRVVRMFSLLSSPQSVRTGRGPWLAFHESMFEFEALNALLKQPGVPVGGSVSTAAFSIALRMGCSPIVLLGQDLAYPGGQTYAAGCSYAGSRARQVGEGRFAFEWSDAARKSHGTSTGPLPDGAAMQLVDAWGGEGKVPTVESFNAFRTWFELNASAVARERPDRRLINASEGGSRIRGFEELRLAELLESMPVRDITSADIAQAARQAARPVRRQDISQWAREQAHLVRGVHVASGRLQRAARAATAVMQDEDPREVRRAFRVLARAEARLANASSQQHMPEAWACSVLQQLTKAQQDRSVSGDVQTNARTALEAECNVTEVVRRAACDLEKRLHALASRHGRKAMPDTEKVRCLC
ncbi:MAG: DUF115 domain-containing protein [Deltaproteobacteria bacterium]|nr:DUF115 domain-containing protein [Deltaproteobacteria bacterium]